MVKNRLKKLEEEFLEFLSKASTEEVHEIFSKHILDLERTAKFLDVSQPRIHKRTMPVSVIGNNHYLLRDLEIVKSELHKRRKRYGTGWSRSGSEWIFSQENVLKTLISLYQNNGQSIVPLKEIIENIETDQEMDYKDKSVRVLFALRKLIDHKAIERVGRGSYRPMNPSVDVKEQLPVTMESYVYDAGDFEPENVLKVLRQMGGSGINISALCLKLTEDSEEEVDSEKAKYLTRKALKKLVQEGSVIRTGRGVFTAKQNDEQ